MKKSIAIVLTIIYLLFNIGAFLNLHFCGDDVERMSLAGKNHPCCPTSDSCCHNFTVQLSIKSDYTDLDLIDFKVHQTFRDCPSNEWQATNNYNARHFNDFSFRDDPLVIVKNPLYLSNRVFLI
jgi:hypothetical protein